MAVPQDVIDGVKRPLAVARWRSGAEGRDADRTELILALKKDIAPLLPAGETASLTGKIAERVAQRAKTQEKRCGIDWLVL